MGNEIATWQDLQGRAREFVAAAKAPATLRAYRADWEHFRRWCQERGVGFLPATPETVGLYLADLAATHRPSTLARRLTSINKAHQAAELAAPARMEHLAVGETLKGIRRTLGTAQEAKVPLLTDDVQDIVAALPEGLQGDRDRAIVLLGFAGGFRRSELAGLRVEDVERRKDGLVVRLRRSKTDPEGQGRAVAIPNGSGAETCPVRAYGKWLERAGIGSGAVFREVDRHGHVGEKGLHRDSVGRIVKRAVERIGLDPKEYGGHSLRAGLATQAYLNGASEFAIMKQTGHRSLATVRKYIREGSLFRDNPASKLGL